MESADFGKLLVAVELRKQTGRNSRICGGQAWERERNGETYKESAGKPFEYRLDSGELLVEIHENPGFNIGARVWDCAVMVSKYCEKHKHLWQNKRIIEVGAGTGIVGLVLARLGAQNVMLTDLPVVVNHILKKQIDINWKIHSEKNVKAKVLCWGKDVESYGERFSGYDYIVLSDMAAPHHLANDLAASLNALVRVNPNARILLGCNINRVITSPLLNSLIDSKFTVNKIPKHELHNGYVSDHIDLYWVVKENTLERSTVKASLKNLFANS